MSHSIDKSNLLQIIGIETERLTFCKLTKKYYSDWLRFCSDEDSMRYFTSLPKENSAEENCALWFEKIAFRYENNLGGLFALVHKETNQFVGQCGLLIHEVEGIEELEIGYSLMPNHRGKGYALEAAKACRDFAFKNKIANSIISIIFPENIASIHVAENNGMQYDKTVLYHGCNVSIYRISIEKWNSIV